MAVSQKVQTLTTMLAPAVAACGFELWGLEFFPQGKRSVLRIYIDGSEGITVEGCSAVSHQVSGILDVEDPIAGEYTLEVSSPGWDRPLFTLAHYQRFVASEVSLRLVAPINARRPAEVHTHPLIFVTANGAIYRRFNRVGILLKFA